MKNMFGCFNQHVYYHEKIYTTFLEHTCHFKKKIVCLENHHFGSQNEKISVFGAHCAQTVHTHYLSFWGLN